ncbi:hypothetical protein FC093_08445 [Ilyomonas limi]|uniref:Cache domain-containing protein n=1 Tax=Ilyomonas limi TaxID=2575867 RepID=A0A4U3L2T2_9BACT|nr:hypothetical protein [Ilyomonas limi]TKK69335.1 hypothetical protein FC093_08445 [Ilyomonas limi]
MSEKGLYSPVVRRIITIILLIGIIGSFLAVYYLVYMPQQRMQYNLRIFRILHEISNSFKQRVVNYGTVYSYNYISQKNKDTTLHVNTFAHTIPAGTSSTGDSATANSKATISFLPDSTYRQRLNAVFLSSFKGNALSIDAFQSGKTIQQDSVSFFVNNPAAKRDTNGKPQHVFTIKQSLADILEPLLKVHTTTFESILLIKQRGDSEKKDAGKNARFDAILYKSENADIANINTDSLFHNKYIEAPVIADLDIEGITYKMFLLPFQLQPGASDTYVLAGIVSGDVYKAQSQSVPINLLVTLCVIIVVLLLVLPFLKIFFLSAQENITIRDVRIIIVVIFFIPFFIVLVCSSTWLYSYRTRWATAVLQHLQNSITGNFYKEISEGVQQLRYYDNTIMHASAAIDSDTKARLGLLNKPARDSIDLKDIIFYPKYYKHFTNLHWMNNEGNDIAVWTLVNRLAPTYFQLSDRQYFRDIKFGRGYTLPNAPPAIAGERFSIQPVLSRLTGEYTINISLPSSAQIKTAGDSQIPAKNAAVAALSSKMYSVWNTIVPKGFAFCIVDEAGNIISHSDTARNLQENILEESGDSLAIRNAIHHKDSTLLRNISLYEQQVRMIIKPMPGLPYYLITYYNKRGEYLFLLHIIAFVFLCQSTLLLFASLFSYSMMISGKRATKLLFTPADLNWLHPSADKKGYYIKNICQCIACFILTFLFAAFYYYRYSAEEYYLFTVNAALLLPLFVVTGYYMVKKSRDFIIKEKIKGAYFSISQYRRFLLSNVSILLLYIVSILLFAILQNVLFFSKTCTNGHVVICGIWILIVLALPVIVAIAGFNPDYKKNSKEQQANNHYLAYFVITLLLAATLISVVPAITFVSYAFRQENNLRLQSLQIDLAKKIQQRRTDINQLFWKTKLNITPFKDRATAYINNLKFDTGMGIYLLNKDTLEKINNYGQVPPQNLSCSPFYKSITRYLFLPPDHDEFYDDPSHHRYYYWQMNNTDSTQVLRLFYNNTTDNRSAYSLVLTSTLPHTYLFKKLTGNYIGWLQLLLLLIFIFVFYKIIYSIAKKIFLIDFFKTPNINVTDANALAQEDTLWLQKSYKSAGLQEAGKGIFTEVEAVNFATIRKKENEALKENNEEVIIWLHLVLNDVYEAIWEQCTDVEKYTLYDFATDGFTNYKQVILLYDLYDKGLLVKEEDGNISLMTKSFRNFLITKEGAEEVRKMSRASRTGSWGTLRTVFYIILIASAIFIFISQEEASRRLITIVTSMGALLPAILKLFDKSTFSMPAASTSDNKK